MVIEAGSANPSRQHRLVVAAAQAGARLDVALAQLLPQHSRSRLQAWIAAGRVQVDGVQVQEARRKLRGGETLEIEEIEVVATAGYAPQAMALAIIHEDSEVLVLDKPPGLVVHPGSGNHDGTLANALIHHAPSLAALPRAGIVHRLDKDTSGLLVVAKTATAQTALTRQLAARTVHREYLAIARGQVTRAMTIDAPIGRHPTQRTEMAVVERGKPARTHIEVIEQFAGATLLRCRLDTGRTHQIRVHLTAIGHPLLGDATYRGRHPASLQLPRFGRQALHAQRLGFLHPGSGAAVEFAAPPPADFAALLEALRGAAATR